MDNCYLCNVNLPKGEGKLMECPHSFSFGTFLLYIFGLFTGGIISYLLVRKNSTLETVCDNCFAANIACLKKELLVLFILMMLLVIICLTVRLYRL